MLTIRLHLDPADTNNGCLQVIPGSHRLGVLKQVDIDNITQQVASVSCVVGSGEAVIMRPLTLHASNKVNFSLTRHKHRRVIHMEYASYNLPESIKWI